MTLNPIHNYTNFMYKCVLLLELELQLSMVNLEDRVQSCRGQTHEGQTERLYIDVECVHFK